MKYKFIDKKGFEAFIEIPQNEVGYPPPIWQIPFIPSITAAITRNDDTPKFCGYNHRFYRTRVWNRSREIYEFIYEER